MSELGDFDVDRSTQRAWSRFQARLADHIADMADADVFIICHQLSAEEDDEGSAPYVQFCAWGGSMVRAEVCSNAYLAERHRLGQSEVEAVLALGWRAPTAGADEDTGSGSANFFLDVERSDADRVAVMTTAVLQDIFAVPHPVFLIAGSLDEHRVPDLGIPTGGDVPLERAVEVPAVFPEDRDHLCRLVDAALTPYFGHEPRHDEDDDIPVVNGAPWCSCG